MKLAVIGAGAMGKTVYQCAAEDETFDEIFLVEPLDKATWPERSVDLIIDFSHPQVITDIYDYCRNHGGNIPVIIGTTGQGKEEKEIINLLQKICPVDIRPNFSGGIDVTAKLVKTASKILEGKADIEIVESHHTGKKDAPSGTAVALSVAAGIDPNQIISIRMGTVFGQHTVYFAMEDEIIEITHTAFSKRIFALGALKAGKNLLGIDY